MIFMSAKLRIAEAPDVSKTSPSSDVEGKYSKLDGHTTSTLDFSGA